MAHFLKQKRKKKKEKKKHNERIIKDRIIKDIRALFEPEEEPKKVSNFWNNNYIEYESNWDKTETH